MKLIIFEGQDRCGKDSHIQFLSKKLKSYTIRHWSFPQGNTPEEQTAWQKRTFNEEFHLHSFLQHHFSANDHVLIWNRSHIGEFVYGTLYRNSDPQSWVPQLETLYGFSQNPEIYLIYFTADPEFLSQKDDGKSYDQSVEKKSKEGELFAEAIQQSTIQKKLIIKVNNENNYRDFDSIYGEIHSLIGI